MITIRILMNHFKLELLAGEVGLDNSIKVADIKRPGIELAGFWEYFTPERIQLLGRTEIMFLNALNSEQRRERLTKFFNYPLPGVIITRNLEPPEPMLAIAEDAGIPLFKSNCSTTRFLSRLTNYLEKILAISQTVHGVLVDVYGIGVLLMGESGIGKSETALELVKRGHRLVADDLVVIRRIGAHELIGTAMELNQYYMELRGIGIIDVKTLFGVGAVKLEQKIHLVLELEEWVAGEDYYDRLGLNTHTMQILDVELPEVIVPVRPGRNLATIVEVAAMNHRLKFMGYHSAQEFTERQKAKISQKIAQKIT